MTITIWITHNVKFYLCQFSAQEEIKGIKEILELKVIQVLRESKVSRETKEKLD